ncbi:MAG: hypothetical protein J6W16_07190 [Methanobrevibacter sp.]|nr:hypothetical protein [Methanobrevibacter sp.]MBP5785348.1 hypothetical protein [Methanobrevibacter sp.]
MAKAKAQADAASIVEEEKTTVETETPVEKKPETENKAEKNGKTAKEKPIADDAKVVIKCDAYAGKELVLPTRTITLDEKGCCEVTGIEAKRLLSLPGYELSK